MAEKNIKNTHPNNLDIPQFCICLHPGLPLLVSPVPCESVFRILSPVSYPGSLSSPSCLQFMTQLCKTNPIPKSPEFPQPLLPQRLTPIFAFTPLKKTNPSKPNSLAPGRDTTSQIRHPTYEIQKQTQANPFFHQIRP